jgi:hypothetical protein
VTNNEFGAFQTAITIQFALSSTMKGHLDDSIIDGNTFEPGSYMDPSIVQGTIATQLDATRRVDFSQDYADGTSTKFLQSPTDPKGWRAAFFWGNDGDVETTLASQNSMTCTGDKDGGGEAIDYDDGFNPGFLEPQPVLSASANSVKVSGPLPTTAGGAALPANYFQSSNWVQLAKGPGVGQMRRVVSYTSDASGVTFTVSPAWDVIPQSTSQLTIGHPYWQVYTVDNFVDSRTPLCLKSNRTRDEAGYIISFGPVVDSTVEGNKMYDTNGIAFDLAGARSARP